jgi:hypothetical protein
MNGRHLPVRSDDTYAGPVRSGSNLSRGARAVVAALLMLALVGCVPAPAPTSAVLAATQPAASLSPEVLEQQYGVRLHLLAVTAVGGLVDLRLQITDAVKAQQLFRGAAPSLLLVSSGVVLPPPEDSQAQVKQLRSGTPVLFLYPNKNAAVRPGDKITVQFGDIRLQSVTVR